MSNGANSIGGVSRIDYYNEEGQVAYTIDVPEELANDPRVQAHDTAEPYGVLDNYDTSEQVLWNVVGYVGNRMLDLGRAREMRKDARKLDVEMDNMVGRLNGIKQDTVQHGWNGELAFHTNEEEWRAKIIGGARLVYHKEGYDCDLTDMRCPYYEPYYTGSQLEIELQTLSKKMNEFFDKYNWEIKREGVRYAKPPQELLAFFPDRSDHDDLVELQTHWNRIKNYIEYIKTYTFEEAFFGHEHTNIEIYVKDQAPSIVLP